MCDFQKILLNLTGAIYASGMEKEDIKGMAIKICENLGLDPYEKVGCGVLDTKTPLEIVEYFGGKGCGAVPDILIYVDRWEIYRKHAALALSQGGSGL